MFKRIRWMSIGAILGVWAYLWTRERARSLRPQPAVIAKQGSSKAYEKGLELGQRLRTALKESRTAMQERERELRSTLASNGQSD
ncbi:MAG TPA: hypothetical protein VNE62_09120 [Actinomycetota bacterium]|nr:hypothetical protein [Actinomycetota bacterium]